MGATTHSIEVNAPLSAVYNQWTQFEEYPRFMEGVREIRQHGTRTLFWKVSIAGKDKEWEAEILEQVPDTRIVWQSVDGTENRGMIEFEPLDFERTRLTVTIEYRPEGILEMAGDVLGIPSSRVEGDLKRFRYFIEQKEMENGNAWNRIEKAESSDVTNVTSRQDQDLDLQSSERTIDDQGHETGSPSLHSTEAGNDFVPKASGPGEVSSQFYREAGVLAPTHEAIARRAYELFLARGRTDGHDREDWMEAERQLNEATLNERPPL